MPVLASILQPANTKEVTYNARSVSDVIDWDTLRKMAGVEKENTQIEWNSTKSLPKLQAHNQFGTLWGEGFL